MNQNSLFSQKLKKPFCDRKLHFATKQASNNHILINKRETKGTMHPKSSHIQLQTRTTLEPAFESKIKSSIKTNKKTLIMGKQNFMNSPSPL